MNQLPQYISAPQLIPATFDLLKGYCGKVYVKEYDDEVESIIAYTPDRGTDLGKGVFVSVGTEIGRMSVPIGDILFDPMRSNVRDHLIRNLAIPHWVRDKGFDGLPAYGLDPWQSAGVISSAAAFAAAAGPGCVGPMVQCLLPKWTCGAEGWERQRPLAGSITRLPHVTDSNSSKITTATQVGWCFGSKWNKRQGPETDREGRALADAEAIRHQCVLVLDDDTLLLPWPGGPRYWPRNFHD